MMDYKEKYKKELNNPFYDEKYRSDLRNLKVSEIEDSFYTNLKFGTAGMRGKMGVGPNRMHKYMIRKVSYAFSKYLHDTKKPSCVIAYDSRINSDVFSKEAAKTLASNGIKVYLFDSYSATPELSFSVRHLKAGGGIVITASHNPPEYNGYKVYHHSGRQLLEDEADKIIDYFMQIEDIKDIKVEELDDLIQDKKVELVGKKLFDAFDEQIYQSLLKKEKIDNLNVVYTPLHGVGLRATKSLFDKLGLRYRFVNSQKDPDGTFPTTRTPNPEEEIAFNASKETALAISADLLIATDPDADRLGVMIKNGSKYTLIDGNQMGVLLLDYILRNKKIDKDAYIITTVVSGLLVERMAKAHNIKVYRTLTGFKHIGDIMNKNEENQFVFAYEESYGYLNRTHVRDKDAINTMALVLELASEQKKKGNTLLDRLYEIFDEYSYYLEDQMSFKYEGKEGVEIIRKIIDKFRSNPPSNLCGFRLEETIDYLNDETGLPKENVLKYVFENDNWFALRPSGTEPKIKIYMGAKGDNREICDGLIKRIELSLSFNFD